MHYVLIRDDDTNALTPVACLERLYRPLLERGLPVNLAVIPNVLTGARMLDGNLEGYLAAASQSGGISPATSSQAERVPPGLEAKPPPDQFNPNLATGIDPFSQEDAWSNSKTVGQPHVAVASAGQSSCCQDQAGRTVPIASNQPLMDYLLENRNFHILQHGCRHELWEFDRLSEKEIGPRLEEGTQFLMAAGFRRAETFVAPYDKLSRGSFREVARRFRVLSTGWYELRRLPWRWWPQYALKEIQATPHWRIGQMLLLSHPGCLLSYRRPYPTMLDSIVQYVHDHQLTVLVTHWWEYFRNGQPDEPLIEVLHETGNYLASHPEIKVITFADLLEGDVPLN